MIKKLRVTVDGATYDVTVEIPHDVAGAAEGSVTATTPQASAPPPMPAAAPPPLSSATPTPAGPGGTAAPGDVPSPLAGRVTAIVVQPGQSVKEGDHLLTLEAMKMNTFVFAPNSGTISAVKVAVGDAVEEAQPLVKIQ